MSEYLTVTLKRPVSAQRSVFADREHNVIKRDIALLREIVEGKCRRTHGSENSVIP